MFSRVLLAAVFCSAASAFAQESADGGVVITAALGKGVGLKLEDFSLTVRGRMQVQGFAVVPLEGSSVARTNGFVIRRSRIQIRATLPYQLDFNLQLAFANQDMEADAPNVLRDAFAQWSRFNNVSLRVGQTKVPFDVQRVVSSSALQFVDRTLVTQELNLDRDVGVIAYSDDLFGWGGRLRYALGIFGGDGRNRLATNNGLLYSARFRFSPFGKLDDKIEGDPDSDPAFRIAFGVGGAINNLTQRPRSTTGVPYTSSVFTYSHATFDVHIKWAGFSWLSSIYIRKANTDSRVVSASLTEFSRSGWGAFAQAGYSVLPWLEFGARYGDLRPFAGTDPAFTRTREIGGIVNFMIRRHDLKLQVDYHFIDNGHFGNGRHQVRAQAQLFF